MILRIFDVDLAGGLLAVVLAAEETGAGQERVLLPSLMKNAAQPAHAELRDHRAGDAVGVLQVAGGAVGDFAVDDLLGDRAAQSDLDAGFPARSCVCM